MKWGLLGFVLVAAPGCSTATAAGCGVGVLAGMAVSGLALAGNNGKDPSVDAGAVIACGSIFGLVSGCSAGGVSEAVARSDEQKRARREQTDFAEPLHTEPIAVSRVSARSSDVVQTQADVNGVKISWFGAPAISRDKVGIRLQRYSRQPVFASCGEAEIRIDERSVRLPWTRTSEALSAMVAETVRIETDIETVRAMATARAVELNLCGLQRRLNVAAVEAARDFTAQFAKLVPAEPVTPPPAPPATPASEASRVESGSPNQGELP